MVRADSGSGDLLGARCEGCVEHRVRCEYPDVKKLERDEESGLWVVRFGTCRCCKSARRSCRPPLRRAPPTAAALQKRRSRKRMSEKLAAAAAGIPYVEKKEDEEMAAQPINEEPDYDGDTVPFSVPLPRCNKHKLCHAANYHDLNGRLPSYFDDDVWDVLSITSPVASPVSSRAPSPEPQSSVLLTQTEAAGVLLSMHLWTSPTASSSTEAAPSMPSSPVESAYSLPPSPVLPHLSVAKSPSLSSYHRRSSSECSSVGPMTPTLTSCVSLPPISALPKAPWLYRKEQAPVRSTYSPPSEERLPMLSIPSDATLYPDSLQAGAITRA